MPIEPIKVELTAGEQIEVLKRFRQQYADEVDKITGELEVLLRSHAEADFVIQYLGEQPEVLELRSHGEEIQKLEQRRQHLSAIIDRLDQTIPKQGDVAVQAPAQMRRY